MFKKDIKLVVRKLKKNLVVSLINIIGLVVGFTFVILAGMHVYSEMNIDRFHKNHKLLYRVECETSEEWIKAGKFITHTPGILNSWLRSNIPGIRYSTRILNDEEAFTKRNIIYNQNKYVISKPLIVDYDLFSMFSFRILSGEINSFENDKYSVVLTSSLAKKVFGSKNPIGESINYKGEMFVVKAVLYDPPSNSSIKFDLLLPSANMPGYVTMDWTNSTLQTFIMTDEKIAYTEIQQKINEKFISEFTKLGYSEQIRKRNYILNPIENIYYSDVFMDNVCIHGSKKITMLVLSLSIIVMIIALINYTNSIMANASACVKEVGIRTVNGCKRSKNMRYLIYETALPSILALLLAVFISQLLKDTIGQLLNIGLPDFKLIHLIVITGAGLIIGIILGVFPAIKLTSFNISDSLKDINNKNKKTNKSGRILSIIQFAASIIMIISVFTIYEQIGYIIKESDKNLDKDIVLYTSIANRSLHKAQNIITIQETLKSLPDVKDVSTCLSMPGDERYSDLRLPFSNNDEDLSIDVFHNMVDVRYPEAMGYIISEGRFFDANIKSDYESYLVNEAFIEKFGVKDLSLTRLNRKPIIGVIKDFHFSSLYSGIEPLAIQYNNSYQSKIIIKLTTANESFSEVVKKIQNAIDEVDNSAISDIHFLDQYIAAQYDKEINISKIMFVLALFSILISCMGLFSMSLFITEKRIKEIGIRKVNGAKVSEILTMLNKDFVKWVVIAFVIATPISYYAMNKWLENFAYKTTLSWWIFAFAGVIALGIALLTVSWQSWKAATRNPVEALRYE